MSPGAVHVTVCLLRSMVPDHPPWFTFVAPVVARMLTGPLQPIIRCLQKARSCTWALLPTAWAVSCWVCAWHWTWRRAWRTCTQEASCMG